jgi:hypothetical protein
MWCHFGQEEQHWGAALVLSLMKASAEKSQERSGTCISHREYTHQQPRRFTPKKPCGHRSVLGWRLARCPLCCRHACARCGGDTYSEKRVSECSVHYLYGQSLIRSDAARSGGSTSSGRGSGACWSLYASKSPHTMRR